MKSRVSLMPRSTNQKLPYQSTNEKPRILERLRGSNICLIISAKIFNRWMKVKLVDSKIDDTVPNFGIQNAIKIGYYLQRKFHDMKYHEHEQPSFIIAILWGESPLNVKWKPHNLRMT